MPRERTGAPDRSWSRSDGSRNVFLDATSRPSRSREDAVADECPVSVGRSVIVVDEADSPARGYPLADARATRRRPRCGRMLAAATVRELQHGIAAAKGVVTPSEWPAIVFVCTTLAVTTVLVIQREGALEQRDRARQQTAVATHAATEARHQRRQSLHDLKLARERARDASHAAVAAARQERRWRRVAARARSHTHRGRQHR